MIRRHLCIVCAAASLLFATTPFERYFTEKTMRLDYFHTGNATEETYSFDEVWQEPMAGSKTNLIDTLNLGKYICQVYDVKTNVLIYSIGFCSIFGEWQTTAEAQAITRTFSESVRFPWPKEKIKVTIGTRDRCNIFQETWSITLDPDHPNHRKSVPCSDVPVTRLRAHGPPHEKVDVVILPDGYTKDEIRKFHVDADRMLDVLFGTEPFKKHKKDFNIWTVDMPSNSSGIDNPQKGHYTDNALNCSFNAFESDRYILTWDNKTIRKLASRVPYDHIYILVNSSKYGGGGIYNLYSTCVSDNEWSGYIFVHEFGHSFGGLGDEYYTSDVAYSDFYPKGVEPWEPNITANTNRENAKWRDLIDEDTPVPTPWDKETFDTTQKDYRAKRRMLLQEGALQSEIDSLTAANDQWVHDFLRQQKYWGKVGVFEGSGYASKGLYRPFIDCRMFTRGQTGFDPVCSRAIERVIRFYSK